MTYTQTLMQYTCGTYKSTENTHKKEKKYIKDKIRNRNTN
jgi:hypothetical protein